MLTEKRKRTSPWFFQEPFANTIPSARILDRTVSFLSRIFITIVRIFLRIILGKRKRETLNFYQKLYHRVSINISFSFYLFMFFYKVVRLLRLGNPSIIKIHVLKYNYKVYCLATEEDYRNMTEREEYIIEHFQPKNGEIVVDVGAHYGRYTLIAAKRVGPKGKVISIEADPKNMDMLNKNIKLNKLEHIITLNYAVSSNKSKVKLYTPEQESDYTIYNTIISNRCNPNEKFIEVNANTLDNLLQENEISAEEVDWIKIDVEGAELEVLKGAHNVLLNSKDIAILIEIHNLAEGRNLYENIMDLLKPYNFKIEFEMIHEGGERHIIVRKQQL